MSYPRDIPPLWFLVALVLQFVLHLAAPVARLVSYPWTWSGAVLIAAGIGLLLWAAGLFRRAETGLRPFSEATLLVRRGPFRFSRNPMYLAMVLTLSGSAVALGSATPLVVPPVFAGFIQRRFIRREEHFLMERFGDEYRELCRDVRRWL